MTSFYRRFYVKFLLAREITFSNVFTLFIMFLQYFYLGVEKEKRGKEKDNLTENSREIEKITIALVSLFCKV